MELWATGFNAWGQLDFEVLETGPRDLKAFKCILTDDRVEILCTALSATLVQTSTALRIAGCPDELIEHCISKKARLLNLAVAGNDKVVSQCCERNSNGPSETESTESKTTVLKQYSSFASYLSNDGEELGVGAETQQVVANQCTFTALSVDGQVWTWGDGRPAALPGVVQDLLDLPTGPIRKVSSGGYTTAALTDGNDLYVWGGRPGQSKFCEDLTEVPTPVDIDGEDVLDVAVGINHMMALTTGRKLFALGDGSNGQLGLDEKQVAAWKEVTLPLKANQRIASVHAGYKNSLVIVEDIT